MTAAIFGERGASYLLSALFRLCAPESSQIGEFPGTLLGGQLAMWFVLLNSNYNFTAVNGKPNPEHKTLGDIEAAYPNSVINPTLYQDNGKHMAPSNWVVVEDPNLARATLGFFPGTEPQILATAQLTNIAGVALCRFNNNQGTNEVLEIAGFVGGVVPVLQINERLRLITTAVTLVP